VYCLIFFSNKIADFYFIKTKQNPKSIITEQLIHLYKIDLYKVHTQNTRNGKMHHCDTVCTSVNTLLEAGIPSFKGVVLM